jgi:hypothetical protein
VLADIITVMTPLQDVQRRRGGQARAANQSESDRKFLATLAASRRPLRHDVRMTEDELLRAFHALSKEGPGGGLRWIIFLIVGADGRTVRSTLDDKTIRQRLKLIRGAIGFMGVTVFGSPRPGGRLPSIQVYYKPLKAGNEVIEALDEASRAVVASILPAIGVPSDVKIKTEVRE